MSYNVSGYIVFLLVIYFVTFHVGWKFYKNGVIYIHMLMPGESHLVESINKMLLLGYYLLNLGYATVSISNWPRIENMTELLVQLSHTTGTIIFTLALMHYFNLTWLLIYSRYVEKKENNGLQENLHSS